MAQMSDQLVERSIWVVALLVEPSKQTLVDLWKKTINNRIEVWAKT